MHDFIAKMQSRFASKTKESLQPGEYLVIADFSENYSAVIQDEIQSYHWNSTQTTIHPFVCYYKDDDESVANICFVIISECTEHTQHCCSAPISDNLSCSTTGEITKQNDVHIRWMCCPVQKL